MDATDEWIPVVRTSEEFPELAWRSWLRDRRLAECDFEAVCPVAIFQDRGAQNTFWILKSVLLALVPDYELSPTSERRPLSPKPMAVSSDDLVPLDSYWLSYRWTDSRNTPLPASDLAEIRPLTEGKAREIWRNIAPAAGFLYLNERVATPRLFRERIIELSAEGGVDDVRAKLQDLIPEANSSVIVSWEPDKAVVVSWRVFREYWDDFCYPSSDDVAIAPLSAAWLLVYSHEERFIFGYVLS